MYRYVGALIFAFSAVALGSAGDISKVNGSIAVAAGQQAGDVSTVNGSVTIGSGGQVRDVETVNGSVRLETRSTARAVETVNGSIVIAEEAVVSEGVNAVNGKLTLLRGARVAGRLDNVNGDFALEGATVGGGIGTVNGDVLVGAGSRVENGIHVEKSRGWSSNKSDRPRVTIESGAVVNGTLEFEREVDLYVGASAVVGQIVGVAPRRHSLP
jgi:DUF4097 and DUF4098 domain-containing protein YvlB